MGIGYTLVRLKDVEGEVFKHILMASDWSQKMTRGASYMAVINSPLGWIKCHVDFFLCKLENEYITFGFIQKMCVFTLLPALSSISILNND